MEKKPQPLTFTTFFNKKVDSLIIECGISSPIELNDMTAESIEKNMIRMEALWDTGATHSVITTETAKILNLKPIRPTTVIHGGGSETRNVYLVHLYLPNKLIFAYTEVTDMPKTTGKFGIIIGMNIISQGDLAITNAGGMTQMSYRFPSLTKIDFREKQWNPVKEVKAKIIPGRNDPCDCNSGKKYKNCCARKTK